MNSGESCRYAVTFSHKHSHQLAAPTWIQRLCGLSFSEAWIDSNWTSAHSLPLCFRTWVSCISQSVIILWWLSFDFWLFDCTSSEDQATISVGSHKAEDYRRLEICIAAFVIAQGLSSLSILLMRMSASWWPWVITAVSFIISPRLADGSWKGYYTSYLLATLIKISVVKKGHCQRPYWSATGKIRKSTPTIGLISPTHFHLVTKLTSPHSAWCCINASHACKFCQGNCPGMGNSGVFINLWSGWVIQKVCNINAGILMIPWILRSGESWIKRFSEVI